MNCKPNYQRIDQELIALRSNNEFFSVMPKVILLLFATVETFSKLLMRIPSDEVNGQVIRTKLRIYSNNLMIYNGFEISFTPLNSLLLSYKSMGKTLLL